MRRAKEEQMPDNVEIIIFSLHPLFLALFQGVLNPPFSGVFCRFYCFYHFFSVMSSGIGCFLWRFFHAAVNGRRAAVGLGDHSPCKNALFLRLNKNVDPCYN